MNKKSLLFSLSCIALLISTAACDNLNADFYGEKSTPVSTAIGDALRERYPDAKYIEWEMESGYYVASFRSDGFEMDAWFDQAAVWCMSVTEITHKLLPQAVQATISAEGYKPNNVDDIHKVERPCFCIHYYIELSQTEMICLDSGQKIRHLNDLPDPRPIIIPDNVLRALGISAADMRIIEAAQPSENVWEITYYDADGTETITTQVTTAGEILKNLPMEK